MGQIKSPYLTYDDVDRNAADVLKKHDRLEEVPVDMEALIEFDMGLKIIPQRGLEDEFGVVGFLSFGMTSIIVDEYVLERQPTRYRFTLAHELGHRVLHADSFRLLQVRSVADWVDFYLTLPEQDYGWFERHAYWFAGALLVPEHTLLPQYEAAMAKVGAEGLDGAMLSYRSRSTVAGAIAKRFHVSTGVVSRRLNEVGFW